MTDPTPSPETPETEASHSGGYQIEEFMLLKQQHDEVLSRTGELEELVKRQQAEFENYRKRIAKEKEEARKFAGLEVFKDLLPVVDNFDRALATSADNAESKALREGIEMIRAQMSEILGRHQVREVPGAGQPFDPELHLALLHEEGEVSVDTVIEVFQKGYRMADRVLRVAHVKVRKPVSAPAATPSPDSINSNSSESSNG